MYRSERDRREQKLKRITKDIKRQSREIFDDLPSTKVVPGKKKRARSKNKEAANREVDDWRRIQAEYDEEYD